MVLLSCEHPLFFKKQGNNTEGDSEIIRTTTLVSRRQMVSAQSLGGRGHSMVPQRWSHLEPWGQEPAQQRARPPPRTSGVKLRPSGPGRQSQNQTELFSSLMTSWNLLGFDLAWNSLPLPCLLIAPFWNWNVDAMPLPPWLFSKHMACVSQVHSWKGILLQDELYLESHSHLIQIFT